MPSGPQGAKAGLRRFDPVRARHDNKQRQVMTHDFSWELRLQLLDARINARGFLIDTEFVRAAMQLDARLKAMLKERLAELTGCGDVRSVRQWLAARIGAHIAGTDSQTMSDTARRFPEVAPVCSTVTAIAVTGTAKYAKMLEEADPGDGRVRNAFIYEGAHTGRWTSEGVQVHNLPRTNEATLHLRPCVVENDADWWWMMYGQASRSILASLVRTAIVAPEGRCLHVADFSSIEARVLAWLAGEDWKTELFRRDGKIYEETAGRIFGLDPAEITKDSPARAAGKISELALGFGGGKEALVRMGRKYGQDFSGPDGDIIVDGWRCANPRIVNMWRELEDAMRRAIETGKEVYVCGTRLMFAKCGMDIIVELPSGRRLTYRKAVAKPLKYVSDETSSYTKLYGGKIAENIVQAVARDVLADAMLRLDSRGHEIILHVHDEIVVESVNFEALPDILQEMADIPAWAPGLPLKAEGYTGGFYKK